MRGCVHGGILNAVGITIGWCPVYSLWRDNAANTAAAWYSVSGYRLRAGADGQPWLADQVQALAGKSS